MPIGVMIHRAFRWTLTTPWRWRRAALPPALDAALDDEIGVVAFDGIVWGAAFGTTVAKLALHC